MHAVIGRVTIKPGREDDTLAMIAEHGVAMLQGMTGSAGGYWARSVGDRRGVPRRLLLPAGWGPSCDDGGEDEIDRVTPRRRCCGACSSLWSRAT